MFAGRNENLRSGSSADSEAPDRSAQVASNAAANTAAAAANAFTLRSRRSIRKRSALRGAAPATSPAACVSRTAGNGVPRCAACAGMPTAVLPAAGSGCTTDFPESIRRCKRSRSTTNSRPF